jgi:hypothetical protein
MLIKNAKALPRRFFGLHFCEGVAEYKETNDNSFRIFLSEDTIKNMDPSFEGKPVYVQHVEQVDLHNLQSEADGYVVKSFYNALDGKHWVEFLIVSDRGHEAIQKGWKLSNAYVPKGFASGGQWHGVEYAKEVTSGEYEHLAIVPNPRYEESVVLTPEEFKQYNGEQELKLKKLTNQKEPTKMKFSFFNKTKVDNAALEETLVLLPKKNREISITNLINEYDNMDEKMPKVDGVPKVEEHEALKQKHNALMAEHEALKQKCNDMMAEHAKMKEVHDNMARVMDAMKSEPGGAELAMKDKPVEVAGDKHNAEEEAKKKKDEEEAKAKKEQESEGEKLKNALKALGIKEEKFKHFNSLKNAETDQLRMERSKAPARLELIEDQVARGKARYGKK